MSDSEIRPSGPNDLEIDERLHPGVELALLRARTRRHFLRTLGGGLGTLFMGTLAAKVARAAAVSPEGEALDFTRDASSPLAALAPQFPAKVRRVIYLHMAGAPSQLELFEYKPELKRFDGQDCPAVVVAQRRPRRHHLCQVGVGRVGLL